MDRRSRFICFQSSWFAANVEAASRWWVAGQRLRDQNMAALCTRSEATRLQERSQNSAPATEGKLLAGLQVRVLREEFIDYVLAGLQEELRKRHDALETRLKTLRAEKKRIEIELARLVRRLPGHFLIAIRAPCIQQVRTRICRGLLLFIRANDLVVNGNIWHRIERRSMRLLLR